MAKKSGYDPVLSSGKRLENHIASYWIWPRHS
jgi:hypothetical protein